MEDNKNNRNAPKFGFNLNWLYIIILAALVGLYFTNDNSGVSKEVPYDQFQAYVDSGYVNKVVGYDDNSVEFYLNANAIAAVFKGDSTKVGKNPVMTTEAPSRESLDTFLAKEKELKQKSYNLPKHFSGTVSYEKKKNYMSFILWNIVPFLFLILLYFWMVKRMSGGGTSGGSGGIFSVGKSKAQLFDKNNKQRVTFKDVAGLAEAKEEVQEIVEFLKEPQKYTNLGGKIPRGALLVGPPGTGKTLLAKAVAGEADVPFFSLSGSDFVEMFVGVGASRVRDLFKQAKEKSPCIVFIDEIDAVGRARGKNPAMGGNDERENTLNQLLTEMDGFTPNSGVIILAATNRVDVLDKALLRAGRFDRQIHVDLPDLNERKEIFGVHLRPIKIGPDVDVDLLARQTPGFSGADIANVCNEAALIAARYGKKYVDKQDFSNAVDRIVGGLEKKNKITTEEERRSIAVHESGHATLSWLLEFANPLIKVTIVPRGRALGAAWYLPEERQITTKEQMLDEMCATLGGRAAEDLFLGRISSGAMNDLERVTKQAFGMITYMGMSDRLPNLCYYNNDEYSFNRPYSEKTAELIDEEVKKMVNEQYERAKKVLAEYRDKHKELADLLIAKEVVFAEDVERIFGKRKWTSRSLEIIMDDKRHEDEGKVEPKGKENKDEKEGETTDINSSDDATPSVTANGDKEDKTDKKQPAKKAEAPSLFDENKDKGETTSEDNNQPS
jgi:cell division protease FtsH